MDQLRNKPWLPVMITVAMASLALAQGQSSEVSPAQTSPSLLLLQNFEGYAPLAAGKKSAPAASGAPVKTNYPPAKPPVRVAVAPPHVYHPPPFASPNERPLNSNLRQLKGIVIMGAYQEFKSEGVGGVQGIDIQGPAFLKGHEAMISVWLGDFLGGPLGTNSLDHMQSYLIRACRQLDRPMVDVYYPDQEIIDGVVQIVVYEGKVGHVNVIHSGHPWFSDRFLKGHIHLHPGDSISQKQLYHDVEKLNRDSQFLEVGAFYKQADFNETNTGSTDIGLTVKERFPLKVFAGYDNYGLKVLGENQIFGGFNYGHLFGGLDQINYQYTTDIELRYLQAHTASFIDPLPWGHTLTIFGGYNSVRGDLSKIEPLPTLINTGYSYQIGLRYVVPLPHWGGLDHDLTAGFDFKSANTGIQYGQNFLSTNTADIDQFVLSYRGRKPDRLGFTQVTLDGYYSPGGLLGRNTDTDFSSFHPGLSLKANYSYGRAELQRTFNLPLGLWILGKAGYQNSTTGLLPSEELYLGGHALLRGYSEDIESGDQGYYASVELHSPLIRTSNLTGQKNLPGYPIDGDLLDIFGFYDYGVVDTVRPNLSPYVALDSAGAGLSYHISQNLKADVAYGFELDNNTPQAVNKGHSRAHIDATLSY